MWTPVLTSEGGTVLQLCTATMRAGHAVTFALTATGVFQSHDCGNSWQKISEGPQPPFPMSMAAGRNPDEASPTLFVGSAVGLFNYDRESSEWVQVLSVEAVTGIGVSTTAPQEAPLFAATESSGLLVSTDAGRSWSDSNVGLSVGEPIVGLSISPRYNEDKTAFVATAKALYRSRNGGKAWRRLDFNTGADAIQCLGIAADGASGPVLFLGLLNGLWSSHDLGRTWMEVQDLTGASVWDISVAECDPNKNAVTVLTSAGCFTSDDSGSQWQLFPTDGRDVLSAALVSGPSGPVCLIGTASEGVLRRSATSDAWNECNAGLEGMQRTQIAAIASVDGNTTHIVVNEAFMGMRISHDAGTSWTSIIGGPEEDLNVTVIQTSHQLGTMLTLTGADMHEYRISDGNWMQIPSLPSIHQPRAVTSLGQRHSGSLTAVSTDGKVWTYQPDDGWIDLGRPFGVHTVAGVEFAPAIRPATGLWAVIYAQLQSLGPAVPALWRSDDSGVTWKQWLESSSPAALSVAAAEADDSEVVFIGTGNEIYKIPVTTGNQRLGADRDNLSPLILDGTNFVTSILPSPRFSEDQTLFVGTDRGVWISEDAGMAFRRWSRGRPNNITGLTVMDAEENRPCVIALELAGDVWARTGRG